MTEPPFTPQQYDLIRQLCVMACSVQMPNGLGGLEAARAVVELHDRAVALARETS